MLRSLCALLILAAATLPATAALGAAEKAEIKFHYSIFSDSPPVFNASGKNVIPKHIIQQKYLFLYFSASWCGPCHAFNPEFIAWYKKNGGGRDFEVVLVGSDDSTASVKQYMKNEAFPWLAFEMNGKRFDEIKQKYGGKGIPCVVLLDENDAVVASSYVNGQYVGPRLPLEKYLELTKK